MYIFLIYTMKMKKYNKVDCIFFSTDKFTNDYIYSIRQERTSYENIQAARGTPQKLNLSTTLYD